MGVVVVKSRQVNLRVSEETFGSWKALAEARGTSVTGLIEGAVAALVESSSVPVSVPGFAELQRPAVPGPQEWARARMREFRPDPKR